MKRKVALTFSLLCVGACILLPGIGGSVDAQDAAANARWSEQRATSWYKQEPWLVGSNYTPADAINELEMWQAQTFDPKRIDLELGWAQNLGMNTMRVFLHDLLWQSDHEAFVKRMDTFLSICQRHGIRPMFVLFDSCWNPHPHLGTQPQPTPGVHNSGWVQSPGSEALQDPKQYPRLQAYVQGVVGAFAADSRILAWDLWNEPDNGNDSSYGSKDARNKGEIVRKLLSEEYGWARSAHPTQPLTSGVWHGDWSSPDKLSPMEKLQLGNSDIITFHNYEDPSSFEKHVKWLQQYRRPIICTEYMARPVHSTFEGILPVAKRYKVGAINWGFVAGKTQTYLPWDSWQHPYTDPNHQPKEWFHEVLHKDGTPYRPEEVAFIKNITSHTLSQVKQ